ncbi:MAG: hypothetical protein KDK71_05450 [Chlamydiia bacterium]|nr:hypothetical protein [Chlamydiia bacterium]
MAKIEQVKVPESFPLPESCEKPREDYTALTDALLQKGEFRLLEGDKGGIEYFEMALKLDPNNAKLYLAQGLSLFEYGNQEEREEGLVLASKWFKKTTQLDPHNFQAWHLWGNTLYTLGKRRKEPSYFGNALKKYEQAEKYLAGQPADIQSDFHSDLGDLWAALAEKSGELTDYHYSIKAYEKASQLQDSLGSDFWIRFGNVYQIVGEKGGDLRFLLKAVAAYKNALSVSTTDAEGWFLLGVSIKSLYQYTHEEDHFSQANECFVAAAKLNKHRAKIWLEWGRLLLESGVLLKDPKKIRASIDKCAKAHSIEKKNPYIIAVWVEALAFLGSLTEKVAPIYEAIGKIEPLIEKSPNTETFYAYGICHYALGTYFNDLDSYYQALEQFQQGLSINNNKHRLWHAMAQTSFAAALLDGEEASFDRSLHFYEKALKLKSLTVYHCHYAMCLLSYGELSASEEYISLASTHFEHALAHQKNAVYIHPDWIFAYAVSLDHLAEIEDNDSLYTKAIDLLNHILMCKPDFPHIHYQLALTLSHFAELISEIDLFHRAIHFFRIAHQKEKENDQIILDWAYTLFHLGDILENASSRNEHYQEAEHKMIEAAKLGNVHAYFALASLYSVTGDLKNSLRLLEKAKAFEALPPLDELLEDEWLENVRKTDEFSAFLESLESPKN